MTQDREICPECGALPLRCDAFMSGDPYPKANVTERYRCAQGHVWIWQSERSGPWHRTEVVA